MFGNPGLKTEFQPTLELGSLDSDSKVLSNTPQNHILACETLDCLYEALRFLSKPRKRKFLISKRYVWKSLAETRGSTET